MTFPRFLSAIIAAALLLGGTAAHALSAAQRSIIFTPTYYAGTSIALSFNGLGCPGRRACFKMGGLRTRTITGVPGWSFTRNGTAYDDGTCDGLVHIFASNTPVITCAGLLTYETRTEVALWNRDLTNAVWTKSSMTAALDQMGVDGQPNSASSITATGANATVLQSITLASSARFQTAYMERITGSGAVSMTMDGGTTWTAVTVTSSWSRVSIPSQTLANPSVGFKLATSGDKIAVDFVDNENGAFATSPIAATSATVTRAADQAFIGGLAMAVPFSWTEEWNQSTTSFSSQRGIGGFAVSASPTQNSADLFQNSSANVSYQVTTGNVSQFSLSLAVAGGVNKLAARLNTNDANMAVNGTLGTAQTSVATTTYDRLPVGMNRNLALVLDNYTRRVVVYPFPANDNLLTPLSIASGQ